MNDPVRISYASKNGVHVIRYHGRVSYSIAPTLKIFLEARLEEPGFAGMVFDLSGASAMDSTNLGLLGRMGEAVWQRFQTRALIVCTHPDLREFLASMSFGDVFHIVTSYGLKDEGVEIRTPKPSEGALLHTMLEAHRSLVTMSEDNEERFRDVVMWLEAEADNYRPS